MFSSNRKFSHAKFILLLAFILKVQLNEDSFYYHRSFQQDLDFCKECFEDKTIQCEELFKIIEYDNDFLLRNVVTLLLPQSMRHRAIYFLKSKINDRKIVAKYYGNERRFKIWKNYLNDKTISDSFKNSHNWNHLQYCPKNTIHNFHKLFVDNLNEASLTVWLYLLFNVQPLLMPLLYKDKFPVPKSYGSCGFTFYQRYSGISINNYYKANYFLRLRIAKQILEAAIQFSNGYKGYRIYITDMNPDNIIYNEDEEKLYFVDLDTVLIVDSSRIKLDKNNKEIHKHEYIECDDCFAYFQEDVCKHKLSDINIFAACQLFREDLRKDRTKGFLYAIPTDITTKYNKLLDVCIDCKGDNCENRFNIANELIRVFEKLLK